MQKAWLEARDWDELLPSDHQREWTEWFRELEDLELVKILRWKNRAFIHSVTRQRTHIQL